MENLNRMEKKFRLFHDHTVDQEQNLNERLARYIRSECTVPKCIVDFLIKCRVRHRIKTLTTKIIPPAVPDKIEGWPPNRE